MTTGYAAFMRFMAMHAAGVNGANYDELTFEEFENKEKEQVDIYMANTSLNWVNTLGTGLGVPGGFGGGLIFLPLFVFG